VDGHLTQTPNPKAIQQKPLLSPPEQPLHAPTLLEEPHQPLHPCGDEVAAHPQSILDTGVPPHRDDRLGAEPLSGISYVLGAILGVGENRPEPDAEAVHPLKQRLEVDLVVLVARSDGEGDWQLRIRAARDVYTVPEDESSPAPTDPCIRVASPCSVVQGSPAVGLHVGAVDGHHFAEYCSCLEQCLDELIEDPEVGLLSESVSELGEEAVAGCLGPESAGPGHFSVVLKPEGQSPVAYDAEDVFG